MQCMGNPGKEPANQIFTEVVFYCWPVNMNVCVCPIGESMRSELFSLYWHSDHVFGIQDNVSLPMHRIALDQFTWNE